MIRSFRSRALARLWEASDFSQIDRRLVDRVLRRLDRLNEAVVPADMNAPGFSFHRLQGRPVRYSIHVNGPWFITFEWDDADAVRVDLENYH
jgi:proteic killer suppression protein